MPGLLAVLLIVLLTPVRAPAQQPVTETTVADRHDIINEKEHHYIGSVEMEAGDTKLYADDVWFYVDENRAVATGNVVFRQGSSQIAADRAEFDTRTRLGIFYNAWGYATVQPPRQTQAPGTIAPPPLAGQDTIVYFLGESVEKIGPRKYRIVEGGFTTCVQPTPRWEFHADTIVLNLDHYTLLTNVVMAVKGVPLLYLPALYYPTTRDDRATGFLIPTYGTSSLRGQSWHNAFFWAVNRSQDATFMHDWFSKTGQGTGAEYRYNFGGGSDGDFRAYLLDDHATTYVRPDGSEEQRPAKRSFKINSTANELLPGRLRARLRVDYFSDLATNQTFSTNINDSGSSRRTLGGNIVGAWNGYSLNATVDRTEQFYSRTSSSTIGSWPRVSLNRNERPVPGTPLYFTAQGEVASVLNSIRSGDTEIDRGLTRLDFSPQIRFPFTRLLWLTANSTATWRDTRYSRSLDPLTIDPLTNQGLIVDEGLRRSYVVLQSQITGPVFNRIWDTPNSGYAERLKHTIEPFVTVARTSAIDNYEQIVKLEGPDYTVGGTTQFTYGLNNRLYAKRRPQVAGQAGQAREILSVTLRQSYNTDARAARVDPQYSTSHAATATNFTPLSLTVRATPTTDVTATATAEFDSRYKELRQLTVTGSYALGARAQSSVTWSKKAFIAELPGFDDRDLLDHSLNSSSTVRTRDNRFGGIYAFTYNVLRGSMIQQRLSGFYNAQCCGVAFEYQKFNFGQTGISPLSSDRRFFMSFTLAGLGNFSPFNGALGGVPR